MKIPWTVGEYIYWWEPRINFTLSGGVLTLKKGSKVYIPNGLDENNNKVFTDFTIPEDFRMGGSSQTDNNDNVIRMWRPNVNTTFSADYRFVSLGASPDLTYTGAPTSSRLWWDTTNNVIKITNDMGSTWTNFACSIPMHWEKRKAGYGIYEAIPFHFVGLFGNGVFNLPFKAYCGMGFDENMNPVNWNSVVEQINTQTAPSSWSTNVENCYVQPNASSIGLYWNALWVQEEEPTDTRTYNHWYNPKTNLAKYGGYGSWTQEGRNLVAVVSWNNTTKQFYNFRPFAYLDSLSKYYV